mmetsp:Transcript_2950/g.6568  ORF Transcript_2950/g.6568 Transcript_2950/m.6568 type:complete len:82 (-) Transcript_2950:180-425(-)
MSLKSLRQIVWIQMRLHLVPVAQSVVMVKGCAVFILRREHRASFSPGGFVMVFLVVVDDHAILQLEDLMKLKSAISSLFLE